jgi:Domain of unknown function (DUF4184)
VAASAGRLARTLGLTITPQMPWTPAHAAAVLPLRRFSPHWLSFPGLVVGSLSPDFGYYVGAHEFASAAHSAAGLFHSCLPTSIALLFVLLYFSRSLSAPLPTPHRQLLRKALSESHPRSIFAAAATCASVVIGAATHVVWDSFTHEARAGVALLPFLNTFLFSVAEWRVHIYSVLQHLSTIVGVACLLICYRRAIRNVSPDEASGGSEQQRARVLTYLLAVSVLLGSALAFAWTVSTPPFLITKFIVRAAICGTSVLVLGYIAASLHARRSGG